MSKKALIRFASSCSQENFFLCGLWTLKEIRFPM